MKKTCIGRLRTIYIDEIKIPGFSKYITGISFHLFPRKSQWRTGSCLWSPCYILYWLDIGPLISITTCVEELTLEELQETKDSKK